MEKLTLLEEQIKENLMNGTNTASLKVIKEETKNLEACKRVQDLFAQYQL